MRSKKLLLALALFGTGWAAAALVAPGSEPCAAGTCALHAAGALPALDEAGYRHVLGESEPWLVGLRESRASWRVRPGDPEAERERLWHSAQPLDDLDEGTRDEVLAELSAHLDATRLVLERELAAARRGADVPHALRASLEAAFEEATYQLEAFHAGEARRLAMDSLPAGLQPSAPEGAQLAEFLSRRLQALLVFRIDPLVRPRLHRLRAQAVLPPS